MKRRKDRRKQVGIKIKWLMLVWGIVFLVGITFVMITGFIADWDISHESKFGQNVFWTLSILINFSTFVATSFFSISIYNHNAAARELNHEMRNQTNSVNKRAENFRNLQFVASNYTIIDFVDCMTLYPEYDIYREKLHDTQAFDFYLLEQGLEKKTVIDNFNDYCFITARMPLKIVEGKSVGKIVFKRFKFMKESEAFRFLPAEDTVSKALLLYNETEHRQEALINLVMR